MDNKYFTNEPSGATRHPRIRSWDALARGGPPPVMSVQRERQALGFGPTLLHVEFSDSSGHVVHAEDVAWHSSLDDWLVQRGARAQPPANEVLRFSFRLRAGFEPLWTEWGDTYFNAVLVHTIGRGPFAAEPRVGTMLSRVYAPTPRGDGSLTARVADVDAVLIGAAHELVGPLRYDQPSAESILAGALATYLDERFHVTDRTRLFGTSSSALSAKKMAALAFADALERVLRASTGRAPSAYFRGAVENIRVGDDVSVDVNWQVIVDSIGRALPEGFIPTEVKDDVRAALERKLAGHDPEVVTSACSLLARTIGGDAETYRRMWGRLPR